MQVAVKEYVVNRFPIMATYAYVIAKKKGYNEELSQALGYGVATGYAILKNVGLSLKTITAFNYRSEAVKQKQYTLEDTLLLKQNVDFDTLEYIELAGIEFIKRKNSNELLGIRRIRGKQYGFKASDFERKVINKLNAIKENGFNFLVNIIEKDLEKEDLEKILKYQRYFFDFWKKKRDEWRSVEVWNV